MATGQTLLDLMEALSPELQLQSGEGDVTKGLLILNAAQDILETILAQFPQAFGGQVGTLTAISGLEYTTFPSEVLRADGFDMLDQTTLLPVCGLIPSRERGGHRRNKYSWLLSMSSGSNGQPRFYWTNGRRVYFDPVPDTDYVIRWYGFKSAPDITAAGDFTYPDSAMLPLASLAAKIIRIGLDDPSQDISSIAKDTLSTYVDTIVNFNRDGAHGYIYERSHDT